MTVIPALMISISGGLIITRTGSEDSLAMEFQKQVLGSAQPLLLASGVLIGSGAFPGLPTIPFLMLGGGLGAVAWRMRQKSAAAAAVSTLPSQTQGKSRRLVEAGALCVDVGLGW